MALTKTDAMEAVLADISVTIELARKREGEDVLNVCEDILEALGMLNMRLSRLEENKWTQT